MKNKTNENSAQEWKKALKISWTILIIGLILTVIIIIFQVTSGCIGCREKGIDLNFLTPLAMVLVVLGLVAIIFSSLKYKNMKKN